MFLFLFFADQGEVEGHFLHVFHQVVHQHEGEDSFFDVVDKFQRRNDAGHDVLLKPVNFHVFRVDVPFLFVDG